MPVSFLADARVSGMQESENEKSRSGNRKVLAYGKDRGNNRPAARPPSPSEIARAKPTGGTSSLDVPPGSRKAKGLPASSPPCLPAKPFFRRPRESLNPQRSRPRSESSEA